MKTLNEVKAIYDNHFVLGSAGCVPTAKAAKKLLNVTQKELNELVKNGIIVKASPCPGLHVYPYKGQYNQY